MRKSLRNLRSIVRYGDPSPSELGTGMAAVMWGITLLNPWYDSFAASAAYRAMASLVTENWWGVVLVLVGVLKVAGTLRAIEPASLAACMGAVLVWTFMAGTLVVSAPYGFAWCLCAGFAFESAWAYWRLSGQRNSRKQGAWTSY